jgi:hypothetical protein
LAICCATFVGNEFVFSESKFPTTVGNTFNKLTAASASGVIVKIRTRFTEAVWSATGSDGIKFHFSM